MPLNNNSPRQPGSTSISGAQIRQALLGQTTGTTPTTPLHAERVVNNVCNQNNLRSESDQQAVLTAFHDLFRTGHFAWGLNAANVIPPWFHVTERGRRSLAHLSRDPMNPDGYLAYLNQNVGINAVAMSYIDEALRTFNADCFKAAAVMTGCAAESTTLDLRNALADKMRIIGQTPVASMMGWQIGPVVKAITSTLDAKKNSMPQALKERYEAFWLSFTGQIRMMRNEAGHPESIDPVSYEDVYASLLIFPERAKLVSDLVSWVTTSYT